MSSLVNTLSRLGSWTPPFAGTSLKPLIFVISPTTMRFARLTMQTPTQYCGKRQGLLHRCQETPSLTRLMNCQSVITPAIPSHLRPRCPAEFPLPPHAEKRQEANRREQHIIAEASRPHRGGAPAPAKNGILAGGIAPVLRE